MALTTPSQREGKKSHIEHPQKVMRTGCKTSESNILRKIHSTINDNGMQYLRCNQEVSHLHKKPEIIKEVRTGRVR